MTDELETLRRELAETRVVLEDLMNERRPGDTWLLKLLGWRTELADLLMKSVDDEFGDCLQCHSDVCSPKCFRFKILSELDPVWLRAQIIRAHVDAITEDRRRFPVQRTLKVGDRVRFPVWSNRAVMLVADEQAGDFRATPFVGIQIMGDESVRIEMAGHVATARAVGTGLLDRVYRVESVRMVPAEAPDFDSNGGR